jgi:hypothetical protein
MASTDSSLTDSLPERFCLRDRGYFRMRHIQGKTLTVTLSFGACFCVSAELGCNITAICNPTMTLGTHCVSSVPALTSLTFHFVLLLPKIRAQDFRIGKDFSYTSSPPMCHHGM